MAREFTCFVKQEEDQYVSLCIELDISSCGYTKEEAVEGLQNAIETYLEFMVSEGRGSEIERPVPLSELKDFLFTDRTQKEQSIQAITLELAHA